MTRSLKKSPAELPQLSNEATSDARGHVLQAPGSEGAMQGFFRPYASREHKKPISMTTNRVFTVVLFGLFIAMLLLSFLMGINVYRSLNSMALNEDTSRMDQSFLANTIHSNDMYDAVAVGQGPEGRSLVLFDRVDGVGTYETRIYSYEGSIVQEYSLEGSPYAPERAIPITESEVFDFSYSKGLLTIVTDGGELDVALRSIRGNS